MKRSEMVRAMVNEYLGLNNLTVTENDFDSETLSIVTENMSRLLAFMEFKGMKPPLEEHCPVTWTPKHVWERE